MPTIIIVVVKADRTIYEIPLARRMPQIGKAINPGISVIDPKDVAKNKAVNLLPLPKYAKIVSSGIRKKTIEIKISMFKKDGIIVKNFFAASFIAEKVLSLLAQKERKSNKPVIPYR